MIRARLLMTVLACAAPLCAHSQAPTDPELEEIVVTSERRALESRAVAASLGSIPGERIAAIGAQHPFELFTRVPGMWLSRRSGRESLPAIRSPALEAGANDFYRLQAALRLSNRYFPGRGRELFVELRYLGGAD
jgi:hypothetical protein